MEFYPISSWKANWSDLSTEGKISVLEEVSFAELATCKPSLWVEDVIRSGRIRMMMQPIVNVANGCTYGYEMLARGISEDKSVISPLDLYSSARQQSQLSEDTFIFINFVPTSIYLPEHCLTTTIAAVDRLGIDRGRIVFEVVETDKVRDMTHLKRILSFYRDQGFRYGSTYYQFARENI